MTPRQRFRIARRTIRRMVRAARMLDIHTARCEYYEAIFELDRANARPLFPAALRCHPRPQPVRVDAPRAPWRAR